MLRILLVSVMLVSMARCAARLDPCGNRWGGVRAGEPVPQTFTSAEGRFRIGLPHMNPEAGVESTGENDKTFKLFVINQAHFEVRYIDSGRELEAPDVSEPIIDHLRNFTRSSGQGQGQFEVDSEIRLAGHPGREFRYRDERGLLIQRIYLVSKRMYLVSAFVPERMAGCAGGDPVKTLDTFEIIEENAQPESPQ